MTWEEAIIWLRNQPDKGSFVKDCHYDEPIHESTLRFWKAKNGKEYMNCLACKRKKRS